MGVSPILAGGSPKHTQKLDHDDQSLLVLKPLTDCAFGRAWPLLMIGVSTVYVLV